MTPLTPSVRVGAPGAPPRLLRVFVVGVTGYIGRVAARELVRRGHEVVGFARPRRADAERLAVERDLTGATLRWGNVTDMTSTVRDGFRGEAFDAVLSCQASRTGTAKDSWLIDFEANRNVLCGARSSGVRHFVLLSALCVQRPRLPFQHAKLAFERALVASAIDYSIVRPTAFFKSLSGQVENIKKGKPFVMFGNGDVTSCKPISEADLACFLAECLSDPAKRNAILPIGGPGPPITPRQQGELLFRLAGMTPKFRRVPLRAMDIVIGMLEVLRRVFPSLGPKAELARIGRYYGTESMLVWDATKAAYAASSTPSYGRDTLADFYARVVREGMGGQELRDHAVF